MEAIRLILAYACSKNIKVYQMEVKSSFLNGELEEEVYIEQPEGFQLSENEDYVCRLKEGTCMVSKKNPGIGTQGWTGIYNNKGSKREMHIETSISR
jgi:hypothetical protein